MPVKNKGNIFRPCLIEIAIFPYPLPAELGLARGWDQAWVFKITSLQLRTQGHTLLNNKCEFMYDY
jgi:hypothetical protein